MPVMPKDHSDVPGSFPNPVEHSKGTGATSAGQKVVPQSKGGKAGEISIPVPKDSGKKIPPASDKLTPEVEKTAKKMPDKNISKPYKFEPGTSDLLDFEYEKPTKYDQSIIPAAFDDAKLKVNKKQFEKTLAPLKTLVKEIKGFFKSIIYLFSGDKELKATNDKFTVLSGAIEDLEKRKFDKASAKSISDKIIPQMTTMLKELRSKLPELGYKEESPEMDKLDDLETRLTAIKGSLLPVESEVDVGVALKTLHADIEHVTLESHREEVEAALAPEKPAAAPAPTPAAVHAGSPKSKHEKAETQEESLARTGIGVKPDGTINLEIDVGGVKASKTEPKAASPAAGVPAGVGDSKVDKKVDVKPKAASPRTPPEEVSVLAGSPSAKAAAAKPAKGPKQRTVLPKGITGEPHTAMNVRVEQRGDTFSPEKAKAVKAFQAALREALDWKNTDGVKVRDSLNQWYVGSDLKEFNRLLASPDLTKKDVKALYDSVLKALEQPYTMMDRVTDNPLTNYVFGKPMSKATKEQIIKLRSANEEIQKHIK